MAGGSGGGGKAPEEVDAIVQTGMQMLSQLDGIVAGGEEANDTKTREKFFCVFVFSQKRCAPNG